ncbi:MAG: hypothetical protein ACK55Z_13735, partial [bacterium]
MPPWRGIGRPGAPEAGKVFDAPLRPHRDGGPGVAGLSRVFAGMQAARHRGVPRAFACHLHP